MTVIVKAAGPADILAMVPSLVGFTPRNSVVILAFRGTRTCGAFRVDLPASNERSVHKKVATFVVGTLCRLPQVDAVVVVICTDDLFGGGSAVPRSDFATILRHRIELSGFEVRESLCRAADGWASYVDPRVPAGGHPLADISDSVAAAAIPDDLRGHPDESELPLRIRPADPHTLRRVRDQVAEYQRRYDRLVHLSVDDPDLDLDLSCFDPLADLPLFIEGALEWDAPQLDAHGALLLFVLQGPPVRDLVMLQWAGGLPVGDQLWGDAVGERLNDPSDAVDVGDLMLGVGPRPDPPRVERGIELLLTLVSWADDPQRPALLCMLAWLNWALGRGTRAGRHLGEALKIDPQYGLAQLLETMMGDGMLPQWACGESPVTRQRDSRRRSGSSPRRR